MSISKIPLAACAVALGLLASPTSSNGKEKSMPFFDHTKPYPETWKELTIPGTRKVVEKAYESNGNGKLDSKDYRWVWIYCPGKLMPRIFVLYNDEKAFIDNNGNDKVDIEVKPQEWRKYISCQSDST